jgi:hypothetical protein
MWASGFAAGAGRVGLLVFAFGGLGAHGDEAGGEDHHGESGDSNKAVHGKLLKGSMMGARGTLDYDEGLAARQFRVALKGREQEDESVRLRWLISVTPGGRGRMTGSLSEIATRPDRKLYGTMGRENALRAIGGVRRMRAPGRMEV